MPIAGACVAPLALQPPPMGEAEAEARQRVRAVELPWLLVLGTDI